MASEDDMTGICTRVPLDGDKPGAMCPACPHVIGLHGDGFCPLCALLVQAQAVTDVAIAHAEAFTVEVAIPIGAALSSFAKQFALIAPTLERVLRAHAEEARRDPHTPH